MKISIKILACIILFVTLVVAFSNSYSRVNIDNIAIVVAIGIDKGTDNNAFRVSFQFTNPSTVSESGSKEQSPSILKTVDASSISSSINLMNNYFGKELSLSHCKLIVFSEEIAKEGLNDEIYTLMNNTQIRPTANIVISKCTAEYYIHNSKPLIEPLISKYYEIFLNSSKFTGYTTNSTIGHFFDNMICRSCNPAAILGGINLQLSDNVQNVATNDESASKSNHSNLSGSTVSENMGLAVFHEGLLVGELNAIETLAFMCITNRIKGFLISVPNPNAESEYIDVYLTPNRKSKTKVSLVNGSPLVKIDCKFSGKIQSMTKNSNYLEPETLKAVSDSCNSYLEYIFTEYLYKTSKELHSDINGIGKHCLNLFFTETQYEEFNWSDHYKDSFFDVSADVDVKSASLLSDS